MTGGTRGNSGDGRKMVIPSARLVRGFGSAPLPVLAALLVLNPRDFLDASMPIAFGLTLLVGVPVHLLLRCRGKESLGAYLGLTAIASLAVLLVAAAILHALRDPANPFAFSFEDMWSGRGVIVTMLFILCASITAALFWWIAVRKQPT